jgi:uncharacterized protein (TIGR03067 family)
MIWTIGLMTCVLLSGADDKAKGAKDADALVGTWIVVSVERGDKSDDKDMKGDKFVFQKDGKLVVNTKNMKEEMTFKVDTSKEPHAIDLVPVGAPADIVVKGIYSIKGDEMKLCVDGKPKSERPTELSAKGGKDHTYVVLKRETK